MYLYFLFCYGTYRSPKGINQKAVTAQQGMYTTIHIIDDKPRITRMWVFRLLTWADGHNNLIVLLFPSLLSCPTAHAACCCKDVSRSNCSRALFFLMDPVLRV